MIKKLSEADTRFRFITPAIERAGWSKDHIRMEYVFTEGQILLKDKPISRGKKKIADYILLKDGTFPIAVIEAKSFEHTADDGLQQAMKYAEDLNLPFAYSTNGKKFIEHDFLTGHERDLSMEEFPTENELWTRYSSAKKFLPTQEKIVLTPDYYDSAKKIG